MKCPQCGHDQSSTVECQQCGIIFSKWRPKSEAARPEPLPTDLPDDFPSPLEALFRGANVLKLRENPRGVLSMLTGWEVAREFDITDSVGRSRGTAAEQGQGFLAGLGRTYFSSWMPIQFAVFAYPGQQLVLTLQRPFFWWFSEMTVTGPDGQRFGSATRQFSILRKRYALRDASGQIFATIATPLFHPWTFPIFDRSGQQRGEIQKRWAGMTGEVFTEAHRFMIDLMNNDWPLAHRAVILATALTIDYDSFESRGRRRSALGIGTSVDSLFE